MTRRLAGARGGRRGAVFQQQPLVRFGNGTFTRASEGSYYTQPPGGEGSTFIAWASSNVLRYDAIDGTSLALFEGPQTNLCEYSEDLNQASWTKTGASISGTTATAPDGEADCCTVAFSAAATDSVMRQVSGTANGTQYLTTVFARRTSGTGNVRLRVVDRAGATNTSSNLAISTTWTRIEYNLSFGTGVSTPEIGIVNASGGGAQDVQVWGFMLCNSSADGAFPTSYIRTTVGSATRNLDLLTFSSMPQIMATGRYRFAYRPLFTNVQRASLSTAFCPSASVDSGIGTSTGSFVAYTASTHFSKSCTWSRNQAMTITPDMAAFTMTVQGAATGDGVGAVGTNASFGTSHLRVGSTVSLRYVFARLGEPYAA